jgi:hypothetical protein
VLEAVAVVAAVVMDEEASEVSELHSFLHTLVY